MKSPLPDAHGDGSRATTAQQVRAEDDTGMSRRVLVRNALLLLAASSLGIPAGSLRAVPLPVILAVVQTAVAVAGMLSKSGPSLGDLMQVQTEILIRVSQQLVVIQRGIEIIINQLDEIKEILKELPASVVREINARAVQSKVGTYREVIKAFEYERKKDVISARRHLRKQLNDRVIGKLFDAREVLLDDHTHVIIPIVATALQIEIQAMIVADHSRSDILAALERYEPWFRESLNGSSWSLAAAQEKARKDRAEIMTRLAKAQFRRYCTEARTGTWERYPPPFDRPSEFRGQTALFGFTTMPEQLGTEHEASISQLVRESELLPSEVPMKVIPGARIELRAMRAAMISGVLVYSDIPNVSSQEYEQVRDSTRVFPPCGSVSLEEGEATDTSRAIEKELSANSDVLISLAALSSCAKAALARIETLTRAL